MISPPNREAAAITPPVPMERHRFHLLDGLRGIAALVVIVTHMPASLHPRLSPRCGLLAVDFFFCLSGFVVAFAYEGRLKGKLSWAGFTMSRLIRFYPMYIFGTVIGIIVSLWLYPRGMGAAFVHPRSALLIASNAVMIPNFKLWASPLLYPFDDPAWSLFYEIGANMIFGALVRTRLALFLLFPIVAAGSFVLLWHAAGNGISLGDVGWPNNLSLAYLGWTRVTFPFSMGVSMMHLYRAFPRWSMPAAAQILLTILITGTLLFLLFTPLPIPLVFPKRLLCASFFFPVIVYLGANISIRGLPASIAAFLGEISYAIYLLHMPFVVLLRTPAYLARTASSPLLLKATVPALLLFLVLLAFGSVRFYETPMRRRLTACYVRL